MNGPIRTIKGWGRISGGRLIHFFDSISIWAEGAEAGTGTPRCYGQRKTKSRPTVVLINIHAPLPKTCLRCEASVHAQD